MSLKADYYSLLGINRDASLEEIKKAFRKMALRYHPEKNPQRKAQAEKIFANIAEAYEVLSDCKMRAIFDQYGEDGLKHGGTGDFGIPGGYKFSGDPEKVFQKFFGVANPFEQIGDFSAMQSTEHQFFSAEGARNKDPPQCLPLQVTLECSLEDLYEGAFRIKKIETQVLNEVGQVTGVVERELKVSLPKGTLKGTRICFDKMGTARTDWITGDVHVEVVEKPHDRYRRDGANLLTTFDITLEQALTGFPVEVTTLDNRKLNVFINEIVHPLYVKRIVGEGMPTIDGGKGDLLIDFKTSFPQYLTAEQQTEIKRILNAKQQ